jgi:hypothetical protein
LLHAHALQGVRTGAVGLRIIDRFWNEMFITIDRFCDETFITIIVMS